MELLVGYQLGMSAYSHGWGSFQERSDQSDQYHNQYYNNQNSHTGSGTPSWIGSNAGYDHYHLGNGNGEQI